MNSALSLLKYLLTSLRCLMVRILSKLCQIWRSPRATKLVQQARKELGMLDPPNLYNIAVVGQSGVGKSSLINGLRKIGDVDPASSATVGETETVQEIKKYVHPTSPQLALWEIPGAGTLWQPATSYFETQKLYAFDCILVVVAERFTEVGFEVAAKALEWGKACVFVRTRADLGVRSIARRKKKSMEEASKELRDVVKASFEENLKLHNLTKPFKLFILSAWAFTDRDPSPYVNGDDTSLKAMDEDACLQFLLSLVRSSPSSASVQ